MTASEILNIVVTVAIVQAICDLLAYWRIFRQEPYARALEKRSRALFRKDKAQKEADQVKEKEEHSSGSNTSTAKAISGTKKPSGKAVRTAKTLERAQQDFNDANANVARFFITPNVLTSLVFVILMRVLGTEHSGKIMGLLPFVPFQFIHRMTGRGLDFGTFPLEADEKADVRSTMQAFSFVFIYILTGLSVKFYVSRLVGVKTPGGADTIFSLTQSTWGQKLLRAAGVDPDELKME